MPSVEKKEILKKVNYIKSKFLRVQKETECVISLLHGCLDVFEHRIEELSGYGIEKFNSSFLNLNNDFEEFQIQLLNVQASFEVPSDVEIVSEKSSSVNENEPQKRNDTESSKCCANSQPAAIQTPSPSSPHSLSNENIKISAAFCNPNDSLLSSNLSSYLSVCDLTNIVADTSKQEKISESDSTQIVQLTSSPTHINKSSTVSLQDNTNANNLCAYLSDSASCTSINDIEDAEVKSAVIATVKNDFVENTCPRSNDNLLINQDEIAITDQNNSSQVTSVESISQISSLCSLSSNLSGYQSACSGTENIINNHLNVASIKHESQIGGSQTLIKTKIISSIQINWPVTTMATITYVENPGNFWMQLDNLNSQALSFPKEIFHKTEIPDKVEVGDFFLALSKSLLSYLRIKVVKVDTNDIVKVFFIDHGSTKNINRKKLRILPYDAYNVPMQVINCSLADISPPNGIWCYAAIQKLKELSVNSLETHIKCQIDEKYAVQLIATVMLDEEYACDIGQSLVCDGFATKAEVPPQITNKNSALNLCEKNLNISLQTNNQLSSDSGVSVTSNQPSSPIVQAQHYSSGTLKSQATKDASQFQNELQELCSEKLVFQEKTHESMTDLKVPDLISFVSAEELKNEVSPVFDEEQNFNKCLKTCTCKCPLHLLIPFPSIKFVDDYMMLVMLSHIVHPNEFYVNMAMESSITIDELLEQMLNAYSSEAAQDTYSILLDDLRVGMFCAAWFDDGNWYRAKVLNIHQSFDQSQNVLVQYVDYGNKAWVKNTDLRTLTLEFSKYPALSVKCSLAAVIPVEPASSPSDDKGLWSEEAVNKFKNLVSYKNCLTAQVLDRTSILNDNPLQILLWDTRGEHDVFINKIFVESGLAKTDSLAVQKFSCLQNKKKRDVEILRHWDPMTQEYNDIQNSYGVNMDDIEVAFGGYKSKDEEYICKYYSLRGYCPRINCPYQHVQLAEGGVTRDQDELFSFTCHPPLPEDESYVLIQVSAVISPSLFYAQLPFGNLTVEDLDSRIKQGIPRESLRNQELILLYDALNKHYTNKPFDETTTIALSYGSLVVARRTYDQSWHRARIIEVEDVTGPAKVFYVDFGNEEWVDRRNIRQILPEYLYAPFQAIECHLYDVEPLGFEKGQKWSSLAVSFFKDLVSGTVMLTHVAYKLNDVLQVSLRRTTQDDHLPVREHLIRCGFGQEKFLLKSKKPVSRYIPG